MNEIVTVEPTFKAFDIFVNELFFAILSSFESARKTPKYEGSIENPQGLTDATIPAVNANPSGKKLLRECKKFAEPLDACSTLLVIKLNSGPVIFAPIIATPIARANGKLVVIKLVRDLICVSLSQI